jgi:hypothetical protein
MAQRRLVPVVWIRDFGERILCLLQRALRGGEFAAPQVEEAEVGQCRALPSRLTMDPCECHSLLGDGDGQPEPSLRVGPESLMYE